MAKKVLPSLLPINDLGVLENGYLDSLETDARYSIEVDPQNRYNFSESQKEFIANYIQFKNVPIAAKLSGIEEELAVSYYNNYSVKAEIRRLNLALYHRAFATKMMGIDEIGGYLTAVLIGENIAEAEKIGTRDKLQVAKMLIDLNKMKQEGMSDPNKIIDAVDIQEDLSNLSVDTIQKLIKSSQKPTTETKEKGELVDEINEANNEGLTVEEINHLKTLPTSELMKILEETNKAMGVQDEENSENQDLTEENSEENEDKEVEENPTEETPAERIFEEKTLNETSGDSYDINKRVKEFFERKKLNGENSEKN